jgi:3-methyl-2-oxobutanoate hydroxymethyltransferase
MAQQVTAPALRARKGGTPVVMVTAYDTPTARIADEGGVDVILVGDSVAMVVLGYEDTLQVTVADMAHHVGAVGRARPRAMVVADLPWLSYHLSTEDAVRNAAVLVRAGAAAVKLEGGRRMSRAIRAVVDAGIPVMGHVGLTPQSVHLLGGFKVQRDEAELLADAKAVEEAGAFAVVVESVPADLGAKVTAAVGIPTVGIGAGPGCDGQVLVFHDMLGLFPDFRPKFVKRYADAGGLMRSAVEAYCREVRAGTFPGPEHGFR